VTNSINIGTENRTFDNTIRIGQNVSGSYLPAHTAIYIAGINNSTVSGGQVLVDMATGKLGVASSSAAVKEQIEDVDVEVERLLALRPVSFLYRADVQGGERTTQYGLIAEEVAALMPELVLRDAEGRPASVRYHLLVPLLLAALQREHADAAQREQAAAGRIAGLEIALAELGAQLEAERREAVAQRGELAAQRELLIRQALLLEQLLPPTAVPAAASGR
jgi:hypothetical protein